MALLTSSGVRAKALTLEECTGIRKMHHAMELKGVGKILAKGAKWGAANLNAAQLSEVGAFLKLGEEILFRCSRSGGSSKKQKTALYTNVPLPVRNSRRLKSVKNGAIVEKVMGGLDGNNPKEADPVISAVTDDQSSPSSKSVRTIEEVIRMNKAAK